MAALLASASTTSARVDSAGVDLGGVFGVASASATALTAVTMELDLEVEADPEAVVVAHLIEPGGAQDTMPLVSRSSGLFGIRTEVRKVDYVVVFEVVGELAAQSQPVRLTDLGVEPALLGILPSLSTEPDEVNPVTRLWGWAGLGLAAAALAALAIWAMPDRRKREKEEQGHQAPVTGDETPDAGSETPDARRQTPDAEGQVDDRSTPDSEIDPADAEDNKETPPTERPK